MGGGPGAQQRVGHPGEIKRGVHDDDAAGVPGGELLGQGVAGGGGGGEDDALPRGAPQQGGEQLGGDAHLSHADGVHPEAVLAGGQGGDGGREVRRQVAEALAEV